MEKKSFKYNLIICIFLLVGFGMLSTKVKAQIWQSLPPYNVLWPLWSPVLSPPDPLTGIPTPLVTKLDQDTILPVQPALVWNPDLPYFYLLYNNIPAYGDPYISYYDFTEYDVLSAYIFQKWPPSYLRETISPFLNVYVTIPNPINLPVGYENLISFDPAFWLNTFIPFINVAWQDYYGVDPALLTANALYPSTWLYESYFGPPLVPAI